MLQASWREMLPELLAFSTAHAQLKLFPEIARTTDTNSGCLDEGEGKAAPAVMNGWDDWANSGEVSDRNDEGAQSEDGGACDNGDGDDGDDGIDDAMLGALGL